MNTKTLQQILAVMSLVPENYALHNEHIKSVNFDGAELIKIDFPACTLTRVALGDGLAWVFSVNGDAVRCFPDLTA